MKSHFCGILVLVSFIFAVSAMAADANANRVKATLDAGYYSTFVGGMSGSTPYNHGVFQQSVTVCDAPTGLRFKLWSSISPNGGFNNDYGDEVDFSADISRNLRGIGFNLKYAYYNLYDVQTAKGDLHAIRLTATLPKFAKLEPYVSIEQDIPTDKQTLPGGFLYKAGIGRQFELPERLGKKSVLNLNLSAGGHDGASGKRVERISYVRLEVSPDFKFRNITISPAINFQKKMGYGSAAGGIADDRLWYGVNFSVPLM